MTVEECDITFRRLEESDLPQMQAWLSTDHVAEWYPIEDVIRPSLELVSRHYLPMIRGERRTDPYLILLDGVPIGFIQTYLVRDHPEYAAAVQVSDGAAGADLFIGDSAHVHRGVGPQILRRILRDIVFMSMGASECIIGPQPQNAAAIRAYEKVGFEYLKTVKTPGSPGEGDEYLMRIEAPTLADR
jgi:RimJ/RimL family protein N-acetyltransferase